MDSAGLCCPLSGTLTNVPLIHSHSDFVVNITVFTTFNNVITDFFAATPCNDVEYFKSQEPIKYQTCDLQNDNSCGEGYICTATSERYSIADKDSLDGTVCCPM